MKKISDNDLTLLYYGEHEDPKLASLVAGSAELSARFEALCKEIQLVDSFEPPELDEDYGLEVWRNISPRLGQAPEKVSSGPNRGLRKWLSGIVQPRFSLAGALGVALIAVLAFTVGRFDGTGNGIESQVPASGPATQFAGLDSDLLLNRSVSKHLDQVNMTLIQFTNSQETSAVEAEQAIDILVANRLYRRSANAAGNQQLAAFLADIEPLLIELAHEAQSASPLTRERMQQEAKNGLLFRVRVMNQQLKNSEISI